MAVLAAAIQRVVRSPTRHKNSVASTTEALTTVTIAESVIPVTSVTYCVVGVNMPEVRLATSPKTADSVLEISLTTEADVVATALSVLPISLAHVEVSVSVADLIIPTNFVRVTDVVIVAVNSFNITNKLVRVAVIVAVAVSV